MTISRLFPATILAATLLTLPLNAQTPQNIEPGSANGRSATHAPYQREQLLTATVHQAWLLSDKNEANFFEMVAELAQVSASNRGITLPDDAATGRKIGDYIKRSARADTDQLLFAVVDKAVRMTSTKPLHTAGTSR